MGGHGGLNILPQKKWNVYNYENREIVARDERLVREERERREKLSRSEKLAEEIKKAKGISQSSEKIHENEEEKNNTENLQEKYSEENILYEKAIKKQKTKQNEIKEKIYESANKPSENNGHINFFEKEQLNEKLKYNNSSIEHPTQVFFPLKHSKKGTTNIKRYAIKIF